VVALLAGAAALALRRGRSVPLLGVIWMGLALAPSLVVAVTAEAATPVAERYLYLPSVGATLAVGALLCVLAGSRAFRPAVIVACIGIAVFLAASVWRSLDWSSNLRLWASTTRHAHGDGLPWVELARAHYAAGNLDDALLAYERARGLRNVPYTVAVAEYNTGVIHLKRQALDAAERAFLASRAARADYPLAHYGLGRVLYERALRAVAPATRLALLDRSQRAFGMAIGLDPSFGEPRLQSVRVLLARGDALRELGRNEDAAASYGRGLAQLDGMLRVLPDLATRPGTRELRAELAARAATGSE
jgi:tetratricopeptide (TPR) repeat protein